MGTISMTHAYVCPELGMAKNYTLGDRSVLVVISMNRTLLWIGVSRDFYEPHSTIESFYGLSSRLIEDTL